MTLIVILWNFGVIWDDYKKSIEWFSDLLQNPGRRKWSVRLKKWTKYSNITENTEII